MLIIIVLNSLISIDFPPSKSCYFIISITSSLDNSLPNFENAILKSSAVSSPELFISKVLNIASNFSDVKNLETSIVAAKNSV